MDENHQKACAYIREAASQGAQLAVLPEYTSPSLSQTSPLGSPLLTTNKPSNKN